MENGDGCQHSDDQLDHRFNDLRDGGGQHIALPLEEAPEGAHDADQQAAGPETADGRPGVGLILERGQFPAEHGHEDAARDAQSQKNGAGGAVDPAHLTVMSQGACLGDHAAHGHGQTGR